MAALIPIGSGLAQRVSIELRETTGSMPIAGAVVTLARDSSASAEVARALTTSSGQATLTAPSAGSYRITVHRIGYRPLVRSNIVVEASNPTVLQLEMEAIHVVLPAVSTRAENDCAFEASNGTTAALLWENIRTALWATLLTADQWQIPLEITTFRRSVNMSGVAAPLVKTSSVIRRGLPFGTISPDTLAIRGFVFQQKGSTTFAAPDAALLLSSQFVRSHCFTALSGRDTALIGLHFEPIRQRTVPDVSGTLWVDRNGIQLRYLEYSYTNLGADLRNAQLGGRLEFERLSTGAWIINEWYIRMPRMGVAEPGAAWTGQPDQLRLIGYQDQGGTSAVSSAASEGRRVGFLRGTVFDSTTMTALPGVTIRLDGGRDYIVSDSAGHFAFESDSGGPHTLVAVHPKLALLGDSLISEISMSVGDTTHVELSVPSPQTFARDLCGRANNVTAILGRALDPDGAPLENTALRFSTYPAGRNWEPEAQSGPHGLFAFCQPAVDVPLLVRMQTTDQSSSTKDWAIVARELVLHDGQVLWLELHRPKGPIR